MKHLGTKRLETPRLVLRRFTMNDAKKMYRNWAGDGLVTKYLSWPTHESEADSEAVPREWIDRYDRPDFYQWAVEPRELGEPIGSIGAVYSDERIGMVHIGYCVGAAWWHKGYTSEALARVTDFFFDEVGANRLELRHDPRNPHSGGVARKCGLRGEGTARQAGWNNQGICDVCYYAILAGDRVRDGEKPREKDAGERGEGNGREG